MPGAETRIVNPSHPSESAVRVSYLGCLVQRRGGRGRPSSWRVGAGRDRERGGAGRGVDKIGAGEGLGDIEKTRRPLRHPSHPSESSPPSESAIPVTVPSAIRVSHPSQPSESFLTAALRDGKDAGRLAPPPSESAFRVIWGLGVEATGTARVGRYRPVPRPCGPGRKQQGPLPARTVGPDGGAGSGPCGFDPARRRIGGDA